MLPMFVGFRDKGEGHLISLASLHRDEFLIDRHL